MRRYTTSYALGLVYGTRGATLESPVVAEFLDLHPQFINALELGTLPPVDLFPILTFVPDRWAQWKKTVQQIRKRHETLFGQLLLDVENRLTSGQTRGAFMESAIINSEKWGLQTRDHLL